MAYLYLGASTQSATITALEDLLRESLGTKRDLLIELDRVLK
jgi:hypothetical protein